MGVVVVGSRGDVQPHVALALDLRSLGHHAPRTPPTPGTGLDTESNVAPFRLLEPALKQGSQGGFGVNRRQKVHDSSDMSCPP